jgi:hypothetical protein
LRDENVAPGKTTSDVILDLVGKFSFSTSMRALKEDGEYLLASPSLWALVRGGGVSLRGRKRVMFRPAVPRSEELVFLRDLIEGGRIRSVIDQRYPLEQIHAAHQYLGSGVARGKVVITVDTGRASRSRAPSFWSFPSLSREGPLKNSLDHDGSGRRMPFRNGSDPGLLACGIDRKCRP